MHERFDVDTQPIHRTATTELSVGPISSTQPNPWVDPTHGQLCACYHGWLKRNDISCRTHGSGGGITDAGVNNIINPVTFRPTHHRQLWRMSGNRSRFIQVLVHRNKPAHNPSEVTSRVWA